MVAYLPLRFFTYYLPTFLLTHLWSPPFCPPFFVPPSLSLYSSQWRNSRIGRNSKANPERLPCKSLLMNCVNLSTFVTLGADYDGGVVTWFVAWAVNSEQRRRRRLFVLKAKVAAQCSQGTCVPKPKTLCVVERKESVSPVITQCTIVSVRYLAADGLVSFECWKIFRGGLRPLGAF